MLNCCTALRPVPARNLCLLRLLFGRNDRPGLASGGLSLPNSESKVDGADSEARACLDNVGGAHGVDELVRELALVLVQGDELVQHELVELGSGVGARVLVLQVAEDGGGEYLAGLRDEALLFQGLCVQLRKELLDVPRGIDGRRRRHDVGLEDRRFETEKN